MQLQSSWAPLETCLQCYTLLASCVPRLNSFCDAAEWLAMLREKAYMKRQAIMLVEDKALAMAVREDIIIIIL